MLIKNFNLLPRGDTVNLLGICDSFERFIAPSTQESLIIVQASISI